MCVVRARGAHLSRHQPPVEKFKCLRVYPKNVHQPWPLALKSVKSTSKQTTSLAVVESRNATLVCVLHACEIVLRSPSARNHTPVVASRQPRSMQVVL